MSESISIEPWKFLLIGLAAGLIGGGLGLGGGIIMVPLLLVAGFGQHQAHATSLAATVLIALTAAISFGIAGEADFGLGVTVGIGGAVGSAIGASLMHRVSTKTLSIVFALVILVAAIRMISGASPLPGASNIGDVDQVVIALAIGLIAGFFAGLAGIGGGVVIVPSTVLLLGLTQHVAQGTSLIAIVLTALSGTLVNLKNKRVRLKDGLAVGAGGVLGSLAGSRLALGVEGRTLSLMFGFLVLFVGLRMLYRTLGPQAKAA